jgi:hypothetical protein
MFEEALHEVGTDQTADGELEFCKRFRIIRAGPGKREHEQHCSDGVPSGMTGLMFKGSEGCEPAASSAARSVMLLAWPHDPPTPLTSRGSFGHER